MPRRQRRHDVRTTLILTVLVLATLAAPAQESAPPIVEMRIPPIDEGVKALGPRKIQQLATRGEFGVYHDFSFSDQLEASGITFVHQVTRDNTVDMKPVHYDHANGLALADVDGDGLLDLYFLTQIGSNELWRNLGGGRFENITAKAGVGLAERISVSAAFADVDNDGDPDLFVTTVRMGNAFFRNDGGGRFTDITGEIGLGYEGHSSGAVFFDYDRDGLLDCFLSNVGSYTLDEQGPGPYWIGRQDAFLGHKFPERTETSILYRNMGDGTMRDVSVETGLVDGGWSGDATFTDLNQDGYPDLYVLNMQGDDHYWENVGGKRFVDRTHDYFRTTPWGAMGVSFFDYDNDGLQDLVVTDMHSDMIESSSPDEEKLKARTPQAGPDEFVYGNALYHNLGGGRFEEVSDAMGAENYWPWGVTAADLNADGWEDLFITASMSYPFHYGINTVLLNDQGRKLRDSEFILGVEPRRDGMTHVPWFELDCAGEDREHERCAGQDGPVRVLGTLGTRAAAIFDVEGDGDLDVVTHEFGAAPQVLISDLAQRRPIRYLEIELTGKRSNRDGLGAEVTVVAAGRRYTQVHDGKSGYLTQSSLPLYFGLGEATAVERIEVAWPSGAEQVVSEGIVVNGLNEIVEPAG
jgi:hypothetical protein